MLNYIQTAVADMLNDRVLPWYKSQQIPMLRILTDRGGEYNGNVELLEWKKAIIYIRVILSQY